MIERPVIWLMLLLASIGAGAVAWAAIMRLTGGRWTFTLERQVPIALCLLAGAGIAAMVLVVWGQAVAMASHATLMGLAARTVFVFAAWGGCTLMARRLPGPSLILWLCACTVFATDWIAAPQDWRSTVLGMSLALVQLTLAFGLATWRRAHASAADVRRDLAGLLVVLALGWFYLAGVDYLTAWIADLPDETRWYLPRTQGAWGGLIVGAACLNVAVPIVSLLPERNRSTACGLRVACASMLIGQAAYLAWMVLP